MRTVKKLLSVLLAVLVCALCLVPAFAAADPAACEHEWGDAEYVAPNRCTDGYYRYTCSKCGATQETVVPAAEDHQWEWVVDMPPTRYNNGTKHEHCTVCGANRNLNTEIPATEDGYDFGAAILKWIDTIGNFFHNIIVQVQAIFNNARA